MISLVDANNFYVSCERAFDPKLEGKPVAVLSNNDGCVISRSPECKALGVEMGTPYFKLKNTGILFRSSNYELYSDMSARIAATLEHSRPKWSSIPSTRRFCTSTTARADGPEGGKRWARPSGLGC